MLVFITLEPVFVSEPCRVSRQLSAPQRPNDSGKEFISFQLMENWELQRTFETNEGTVSGKNTEETHNPQRLDPKQIPGTSIICICVISKSLKVAYLKHMLEEKKKVQHEAENGSKSKFLSLIMKNVFIHFAFIHSSFSFTRNYRKITLIIPNKLSRVLFRGDSCPLWKTSLLTIKATKRGCYSCLNLVITSFIQKTPAQKSSDISLQNLG